jgi:hypothetical protein
MSVIILASSFRLSCFYSLAMCKHGIFVLGTINFLFDLFYLSTLIALSSMSLDVSTGGVALTIKSLLFAIPVAHHQEWFQYTFH